MTAAPEKLAVLRDWVTKVSGACFHAQQSVEKYVKALLVDRDSLRGGQAVWVFSVT